MGLNPPSSLILIVDYFWTLPLSLIVCQDFQWAKDRICQMSGWKVNCAKYKATEKLFTDIWTSLVQVADTDHDGKITRLEYNSFD